MTNNIDDSLASFNSFMLEDTRPATDCETAIWMLDDGTVSASFQTDPLDDDAANSFLDDGPVLRTTWMVHDRLFPDGQREICATRSVRIRQKGPLPLQNRSKRGESTNREQNDDDSAKRAKQAVRLRCKTIGVDRMLTLTYRENMRDFVRLKKHWDLFRRRMGKGYINGKDKSKKKPFHYVATVERQERGAFHIHVAVRGRQMYQLVRSIWQSIVGLTDDGKQAGQINVRDPHKFGFGKNGAHRLAGYISKYISKDSDIHDFNAKRYWSSRGIVLPQKIYYQLPYGSDAFIAFSHVMQLAADHNNVGMTYFSNQALGVCWVATAPCRS